MKRTKAMKLLFVVVLGIWFCNSIAGPCKAVAGETLKFSCSAQLYDILQNQILDAFTKETGIYLDLFISSSPAALYRLYNRACDVAGTAEPLDFNQNEYGYTKTQVCQTPMIVITHRTNPASSLSKEQLQAIFRGEITNWKQLGGIEQEIIVVVPDTNTAAYKNFSLLALKRFDIDYAIMTKRSTRVVEIVQHIPGSISFITKGSHVRDAVVKILKVDDIAYNEQAYPFTQKFSLVTRRQPDGPVKHFVDFITSERTSAMLLANGVIPVFLE